ncbi:MAG: hypothetical protein ACLPUG_18565 [Acidimicrobiales bacterium]|jgi:hypothetical protein
MKKTFITIISAVCIVAISATMAVGSTMAPKSVARSTIAGALSASSGFPSICPPAKAVGTPLGLTVSKPTVVIYVKGFALECKYMNGKSKTTLSYTSETRKAFLAAESALPKTSIVIVTLGKGVAAYRMPPYLLSLQYGTLECVIETLVSAAHEEALAKALLSSYW